MNAPLAQPATYAVARAVYDRLSPRAHGTDREALDRLRDGRGTEDDVLCVGSMLAARGAFTESCELLRTLPALAHLRPAEAQAAVAEAALVHSQAGAHHIIQEHATGYVVPASHLDDLLPHHLQAWAMRNRECLEDLARSSAYTAEVPECRAVVLLPDDELDAPVFLSSQDVSTEADGFSLAAEVVLERVERVTQGWAVAYRVVRLQAFSEAA